MISLTSKGEKFVADMAARGEAFMRDIVEHLPAGVATKGIEYFQEVSQAFKRSRSG